MNPQIVLLQMRHQRVVTEAALWVRLEPVSYHQVKSFLNEAQSIESELETLLNNEAMKAPTVDQTVLTKNGESLTDLYKRKTAFWVLKHPTAANISNESFETEQEAKDFHETKLKDWVAQLTTPPYINNEETRRNILDHIEYLETLVPTYLLDETIQALRSQK